MTNLPKSLSKFPDPSSPPHQKGNFGHYIGNFRYFPTAVTIAFLHHHKALQKMQWQLPLNQQLDQLAEILDQLSPTEYTMRVEVLTGATIGQHVRHIIECWQELEKGYHTASVNYDQRQRDRQLETDPQTAITRLHQLK